MSDSDKMREDFETVVRREGWSIRRSKGDSSEYWSEDTTALWQWWKTAYLAGRKAEREAMQLKNWDGIRLGTTGNQEGEG